MSSRGCPYRCTYCFHTTMAKIRGKEKVRQRSEENVIEELIWAKENFNFKIVYFVDDNFTTNPQWLISFLKLYKKKINLPFGCASHPESMSEDLAKSLSDAGCIFITVGVQSLNQKISRDIIKRPMNPDKIIDAVESLKRVGIMVQVDHMLGLPQDTLENQEEAVLFYNQLRPELVSVFWLTYYPQTPIIDTAYLSGVISNTDIKKIEMGINLTNQSLHSGGSLKEPEPFYGIQFLLNYLNFFT